MKEELKEAQSRVLQKIGGNILLYQQFEILLKHLLAKAEISGRATEIQEAHTKQVAALSKQTMGQLTTSFLETMLSETSDISEGEVPVDLTGVWVSIRINLKVGKEYIERKRNILKIIVAERNYLVHHFITKYSLSSVENCIEAVSELNQQRAQLELEIDEIRAIIDRVETENKDIAAFLQSAAGKQAFISSFAQREPLTTILKIIEMQIPQKDGWANLTTAMQCVQKEASEEFALLRKKYKVNALKAFIVETGLFEVEEEMTPKGGVRVLYRRKVNTEKKGNE